MDMKYKNIIFDLDGTLLDTYRDIAYAMNRALEMYGLPKRSDEEIISFLGGGIGVLISKAMNADDSHPLFKQVQNEQREYYKAHSMDKTKMFPGMEDVLKKARESGIKMGVVTNKMAEACTSLKKRYFDEYISAIVGLEEGMPAKPDPFGTFKALEVLGGKPEETLFVGDSDVDAMTAEAAGIDCVLCAYGYMPLEVLKTQKSIGIIEKPIELLEYLF